MASTCTALAYVYVRPSTNHGVLPVSVTVCMTGIVCVAASLNMWQEAGIRAVWVRVAIEHSVLVPVVTEVGSCRRRHGTGWASVLASCQQRLIDVKHQLFNAGWVFLTLF